MKKNKRALKVLPKKILSTFLAIATLFTNFIPLTTVFAITENERQELVEINMRGASNITIDEDNATINYEGGYVTAHGNNLQTDRNDNWNFGDHIGTMFFLYTSSEEITFDFFPNENNTFEVRQNGNLENIDGTVYTMSDLKTVANGGNYDIDISFRDNNNAPQPNDDKYTIDFGHADWHFGEEIVAASVDDLIINEGAVSIDGDTIIHLDGFNHDMMYVRVVAQDGFNTRLIVNNDNNTCINCLADNNIHLPNILTFEVLMDNGDEPHDEPSNPELDGNTTAIIRIKGIDGMNEFDKPYNGPGEVSNETKFTINGGPIFILLPDGETFDNEDNFLYNQIEYKYDAEENDTTIKLGLYLPMNLRFSNVITVNGINYQVSDYLDYDNQDNWLTHVFADYVGFELEIPKSNDNIYNIIVQNDESPSEFNYIREFYWTNNEEEEYMHDEHGNIIYEDDEPLKNDSYIPHVNIKVLEASYEVAGKKYTHNSHEFQENSFVHDFLAYEHQINKDFENTHIMVPTGATLKVCITPEYGYQITKISTPGNDIYSQGDNPCEFIIYTDHMLRGNDFIVEVSKVDNKIIVDSDNISDVKINLPDDLVDSGTVNLKVKEINPDNIELTKFQNFANGYNIEKYLDINLNQMIYDGNALNSRVNHLTNIKNKVTISLKLSEGIDADNIVIIHNINNSGNFEIINLESYDKDTNTITFKTDSFSTFAIASKSYTEITEVSINLEAPISGEKINVVPVWNEEAQMNFDTPDKTPNATTSEDIPFTIDATAWVNGTCNSGSSKCDELFNGTFQADDYYYAKIYISSKEGFKLTLNTLDNITVNGHKLNSNDGDEFFTVYGAGDETNTMFVVKIKADENTNIVQGDLNGNGKIDLPDIIIALKKYLGLDETTSEDINIADMDNDGKLSLKDIISLLKTYLGIN